MRSRTPSGHASGRPQTPASAVILGYVSRPNGLRGAVVVHSDPSMSAVLVAGLQVELLAPDAEARRTRIKSAAPVRGGLRVTFDDVHDRNAAEALVGATISVGRDELAPHLGDGEYLDVDLMGLEVFTGDGNRVGRIVEVVATGANDVYVARGDDGAEVLIPAVAHAVLSVDTAAGRMTVAADALEYGAAPAAHGAAPASERGDAKRGDSKVRGSGDSKVAGSRAPKPPETR